jgi:hypothetical protein
MWAVRTAEEYGVAGLAERAAAVQARIRQAAEDEALPAPPARHRSAREEHLLRREGEYWTIGYQGEVFRLRDTKGLHYLARLLCHPHLEFHVLDLVVAGPGAREATPAGSSEADLGAFGLRVSRLDETDELLDPAARSAYQRRLTELRTELAEAQTCHDRARTEQLQRELDFLTRELARAVGLRGRSRPAVSCAERARVNVTRAVRAVMRRIAAHHRALGQHLAATVSTGFLCAYTPDPRAPLCWRP